jgi:hypothetical protein
MSEPPSIMLLTAAAFLVPHSAVVGLSEHPLRGLPTLPSKDFETSRQRTLGLTTRILGRQSHRTQKRFYILTLHITCQTIGEYIKGTRQLDSFL